MALLSCGRRGFFFLLLVAYLVVSLGFLFQQPSFQRIDVLNPPTQGAVPERTRPPVSPGRLPVDPPREATAEPKRPVETQPEEVEQVTQREEVPDTPVEPEAEAPPQKPTPNPEELAALRAALTEALNKLDRNRGEKLELPTGPGTFMEPDVYHQIISDEGNCLTMTKVLTEHGCPQLKFLPCETSDRNQVWKSTSRGIESFGKCLDMYTDETKLHACNCHNGPNQEWKVNYYLIQSLFQSKRCLYADEEHVRLSICSPLSIKEKFKFVTVEDVWSPVNIPRTPVDNPYSPIPAEGIVVDGRVTFADEKTMAKVKEMMRFAWSSYEAYAWGADELKPESKTSRNWMGSGMAATIVDSLDTLYIMDMKPEYEKARDYVINSLNFENAGSVSFFETVIRALGGLLAAYGLTKDREYVKKAHVLGERLHHAFNSPSGLPYSVIDLRSFSASNHNWNARQHILAEVGTVQLEFKYLSEVTGDKKFAESANKVNEILKNQDTRDPGLYPVLLPEQTGNAAGVQDYTLGGLSDSFYEYLLKQWIQTGKTETRFKEWYEESAKAIKKSLIGEATVGDKKYIYTGKLKNGYFEPKMEHLACFSGGMFALGLMSKASLDQDDMRIAEGLTETCQASYSSQASGLGPEKFGFEGTVTADSGAHYYILRPEYVESLFYLWRATKKPIYREWGWKVIQALETHCRTESGYTGLNDVTSAHPPTNDVQESFFLAETLKYLYLLYADDSLIPLDKYVFNTEAHPLPIFVPTVFDFTSANQPAATTD